MTAICKKFLIWVTKEIFHALVNCNIKEIVFPVFMTSDNWSNGFVIL